MSEPTESGMVRSMQALAGDIDAYGRVGMLGQLAESFLVGRTDAALSTLLQIAHDNRDEVPAVTYQFLQDLLAVKANTQ